MYVLIFKAEADSLAQPGPEVTGAVFVSLHDPDADNVAPASFCMHIPVATMRWTIPRVLVIPKDLHRHPIRRLIELSAPQVGCRVAMSIDEALEMLKR